MPKPNSSRSSRRNRGRYSADTEGKTTYNKKLGSRPEPKSDHAYNDPSWYANNPQLLKDAGAYSFNNAVGSRIFREDSGLNGHWNYKLGTPGVMSLHYVPTFGISLDKTSAVNIAATNIYSFVRHANSGSANYEAPDLMKYILAMDSAYQWLNVGQRAYGLMRKYSQMNKYLAKAIVDAAGISFDSIESDLAGFRYRLNQYSARLNAMYVPSKFPFFDRHGWMSSKVWRDSDSLKSQLYVYVPDGYYYLDETTTPAALRFQGLGTTSGGIWPLTMKKYFDILEDIVSRILTSEDMNIMSGDILKAYTVSNTYMVSGISEEFEVTFEKNDEVLSQIHNAMITNVTYGSCALLELEDGTLYFHPYLIWANAPGLCPFVAPLTINMYKDEVTPEDVLVATRLKCVVNYEATIDSKLSSNANYYIESCGSEIINSISIFTMDYSSSPAKVDVSEFKRDVIYETTMGNNVGFTVFTAFDWSPVIWIMKDTTYDRDNELIGYLCDWNNWTYLTPSGLMKMHDTAILSMLDVPYNGKI